MVAQPPIAFEPAAVTGQVARTARRTCGRRLAGVTSELVPRKPPSTLTTAELAEHAHISMRTVERRFAAQLSMSAFWWLLQQRVRCAQEMLESTDRPID